MAGTLDPKTGKFARKYSSRTIRMMAKWIKKGKTQSWCQGKVQILYGVSAMTAVNWYNLALKKKEELYD